MWLLRKNYNLNPIGSHRSKNWLIDKDFQLRYTLLYISIGAVGIFLVMAPIYFYLNENYEIFYNLSYKTSPDLLKYLERERVWMNTLLFSITIGLLIFVSLMMLRTTHRIIGPIKVLKNHLKKLTRGHWSINPVKIREEDEFHDLVDSYNYFYQAFQNNMMKDLNRLKKIKVDKKDFESYNLWKQMLQEKSEQLNDDHNVTFLSDAIDDEDPFQQNAS